MLKKMKINQISTRTLPNRYPEIFSEIQSIIPKPNHILSFGCSYRLECESLQEKYFPDVDQTGFDINSDVIRENLKNNQYANIHYTDDIDSLNCEFDLVFAMSVLCRWSSDDNFSYKFNTFDDTLRIIDRLLVHNGYLCIYNSTYLFTDSSVSKKYQTINTQHTETGFVIKYDSLQKNIIKDYPYYLFQKIKK
jgi:hypothetical protein